MGRGRRRVPLVHGEEVEVPVGRAAHDVGQRLHAPPDALHVLIGGAPGHVHGHLQQSTPGPRQLRIYLVGLVVVRTHGECMQLTS